jgi:predicted  nucleic acid-binding Zn-ribbon protein
MARLLKTLLGNGSSRSEMTAEMHAVLSEMRKEATTFEALMERAEGSVRQFRQLEAPIAQTHTAVGSLDDRMRELESRLEGMERHAAEMAALQQQADEFAKGQRRMEAQLAHAAGDTERIQSQIEEVGHLAHMALSLK